MLQWYEGGKSQGAERSAQTVAPGGQGDCQVQERAWQVQSEQPGERLHAKRRKVHARIVQVRNDNHHKATTAIAKCAGRVVVESLNVSGMMKNGRLSRAIADAGMAGLLAKLEYKCAWYGAEYIKADRWFPSSKLCARCGWHNGDLSLSDRGWRCGGCGAVNERDANAVLNLEMWPGLSFPAAGRGDRVSPAMSALVCEASMEAALTSLSEIRSD